MLLLEVGSDLIKTSHNSLQTSNVCAHCSYVVKARWGCIIHTSLDAVPPPQIGNRLVHGHILPLSRTAADRYHRFL